MAKKPPEPGPPESQPPEGRPFCRAETKAGAPCQNRAAVGSAWCGAHGGGKRPVGRLSKLDAASINAIVEVVERGVTWAVAAQSVGIAEATLHEWRRRGEEDLELNRPTLFADLVERLTRATAVAESTLVADIARDPDWRAKAWVLTCRYPSRYAKRDKALDEDRAERALPRTVAPPADRREEILGILAGAMKPPAGADAPPA